MRFTQVLLTTSLALLFVVSSVSAHHSMERFDTSQELVVQGIVTRVEWVNPHVYVFIDEIQPGGDRVSWEIEAGPPAALRRMGWLRNMLNVGDPVVITGNPGVNQSTKSLYGNLISAVDHTLWDSDSAMTTLSSAGNESGSTTDSLEGTWITLLDLSIFPHFFFRAGNEELTEKGRLAWENYDEGTMNPGIECIPITAPSVMIMPDTKRIVIESDRVLIGSDYEGIERTIYLGDGGRDEAARSLQGYSIGRWQDNSLLIETTHFSDHSAGNATALPSGAQKRLTEKLSLNEDGKSLSYQFEVTDPEYLGAAVNGEVQWAFRPDLDFLTEECNLENASRFLSH